MEPDRPARKKTFKTGALAVVGGGRMMPKQASPTSRALSARKKVRALRAFFVRSLLRCCSDRNTLDVIRT